MKTEEFQSSPYKLFCAFKKYQNILLRKVPKFDQFNDWSKKEKKNILE